ncbi:hypothetical protein M406DRAFT_334107 [Cryphonectria parasitica EP155]|uniref:C2H2-type domain-containing protein n=1 Tax=Cryphonectria parasitica (strain ATCC 38755 / EP155) TaxID=660469 RepID=A0A9P5CIE0_CRYP1|nr:uncharacterized protein M406DRAFT_334107 [Cryphonectria parasitica EP155]KAF3760473.1 hypothetical protein M406DRAFT_334107 [Cryphonectria parasitica EP155]
MGSPPKPVEAALNSVGSSLPVPAASLAEPFGDLQTTGIYFVPHRSHAPSSECDTLGPSDSGYGSASRTGPSVANGSVYGDCDRSGETASVASHSMSLPYASSMLSSGNWRSSDSALEGDFGINENGNELVCHVCKAQVKNKSELKAKHEKPHRCKVPGCQRIEGFSTTNDVERHMRSRHPGSSSNGKYYKCGVPDCRTKGKVWPRADNFRQHLKRIHKISAEEHHMEKYVFKPPPPAPSIVPDYALAGLGSLVGDTFKSLGPSRNSGILGPSDDWALFLQSVSTEGQRDPSTASHHIHQHIFQGAVVPEQQLMITATTARTRDPSTVMQIQPVDFDVNTVLSHLGARSLDLEEGPSLANAVAGRDTDFRPISFVRSSGLDHKSVGEGEQSHTQDIAVLTPSDASCELPIGLTPRHRSIIGSTTDTKPSDVQDDFIDARNHELSPLPTPHIPSPPGGTETARVSRDVAASQPGQSRATGASLGDQSTDVKNKATDLLTALEDKGTLAEFLGRLDKTTLAEALGKLGYEKQSSAEAKGEVKAETNTNTSTSVCADVVKNPFVCSEDDCNKSFKRECELRKHLKRHVKPYSCTFPDCHKNFGSKNDWKRHENSQHYQLELWQCNVGTSVDADVTCGRTYNRREQFKTHLAKDHGITDPSDIESRLQSCLDGRNYEVSFWCGFCRQMVRVKEKGLKAWVSRFNHIEQHYADELDISQWKSVETGMEVKVVLKEVDPAVPSLKRHVDEDTKQSRPQKKARIAVWYCLMIQLSAVAGSSASLISALHVSHPVVAAMNNIRRPENSPR